VSARVARTTAQAKVNLYLRILAREASGYHQLETLFCRLELGDAVTVRTEGRARSLDCSGPALPDGGLGPVERNLAWRAALAYGDASGWPAGFTIEIDKRVPVGGGLGGGSADAGAVLRCLDALAPAPLGETALLGIAATLGADVPFVTASAPLALAWGRGERMLALPPLPRREVHLFVQDFGVPTAEAFAWLAEARAGATTSPAAGVLSPEAFATWESVAAVAANDLEAVVLPRYPPLAALRAALAEDGGHRLLTLMSGSGATVFSVVDACEVPVAPMRAGGRVVRTATAERVASVEVVE
jgi:4-diphosphocytidyl-2-C-methyl-D-erythritol kinase